MIDPTELAARFDVAGLTFESGRGGQTVCRVRTHVAEAEVYLHGAHVTHFQATGATPVLWLSDEAVFDGRQPIRGGIPICFPWFADNGPAGGPKHGLVRDRAWELAEARAERDDVVLVFRTGDDETTRAVWPHAFCFDYEIRVGRQLVVTATVANVGEGPLSYELALHTYVAVDDVRRIALRGFDGATYIDSIDGRKIKRQQGEPQIDGEVDRIYQGHEADVEIVDGDRRVIVAKSGGRSTVLWNPHVAKAKRMADFGDEEWPRMLCVESAAIGEHKITLVSGASHALSATLGVGRS